MTKPITLASDTITAGDTAKLATWLTTYPRPQLTKGPMTEEFERQWAEAMGVNYAVFVNSGSSANLLMIYALMNDGLLSKGDKVAVPALSWITDISPVIQLGLQPVLVDCNMEDLSIDIEHFRELIGKEQIRCLILVPVLGMVPEMEEIQTLCDSLGIILLVDNCEGQGSSYRIPVNKMEGQYEQVKLERFGMMASCSTYYGHILSTIEGGMITTDDKAQYNLLKMLRSHGWDRDVDDELKAELRKDFNVSEFNAQFTFYYPAFNVRSTDLQAFIGIEQLKRLTEVTEARFNNYKLYYNLINNFYWKQEDKPGAFVSNLGYPVIHPRRDEIVADLQANGVQARPLISGSMGEQPFFIERFGRQVLPNAAIVDKFGFYVPNHPYLEMKDIEFIADIINKYTADQSDTVERSVAAVGGASCTDGPQ